MCSDSSWARPGRSRDIEWLTGRDSPPWLFAAILSIAVAVATSDVAFAIWRECGLAVWLFTIAFLVVFSVDHMDAVTPGLAARHRVGAVEQSRRRHDPPRAGYLLTC
jgi:hypothetical protein